MAELGPLRNQRLEAINVPEILNGHYDTVDTREFAAAVHREVGHPIMLNRVVVHNAEAELQAWATSTKTDYGIDDLVLVGGDSSSVDYPGVTVLDALELLQGHTASLGVITIPTRRRQVLDEPERLVQKQRAGATHAISQILLESESPSGLQHDYAVYAQDHGVAPIPLYWSLAPVQSEKDIAFLRWLGVNIPRDVERWLRDAPRPAARLKRSHEINLAIARNLLEDAEAEEHGPIGFCIEHVMANNLEPAIELVQSVQELCAEFRALASV